MLTPPPMIIQLACKLAFLVVNRVSGVGGVVCDLPLDTGAQVSIEVLALDTNFLVADIPLQEIILGTLGTSGGCLMHVEGVGLECMEGMLEPFDKLVIDVLVAWWKRELPLRLINVISEELMLRKGMTIGTLCTDVQTVNCLNLQWSVCLVYLDDIIVLRKNFGEHLQRLCQVLSKLQAANIKVKPSNCNLFATKVQYLGHTISPEGAEIPVRRFVKGIAELARPLHRMTEKGRQFQWDDCCQVTFEKLKFCLITAPILAYPDPQCSFILDTDASGMGIVPVLSQKVDLTVMAGCHRTWTGMSKIVLFIVYNLCTLFCSAICDYCLFEYSMLIACAGCYT
ncbi:Retrovirus-related Pol polyprotein from transposon 17.6 [Labeo rohita]|uniref:ribonuclease H n=1 Tax=Labeo rohita TaxID=84645 RepID=A0ABQ8M323_LABRO|nr:Retrovirus-related Pol polyprotein from transposon 17.6 [Labeo rohita]